MQDVLQSLVLGAIQGLTEFLPISSSGHLLLAHELLGFTVPNELTFDVALHVGTLLALMLYFWHDLDLLLRGWLTSFTMPRTSWTHRQHFAWMIIVAAIPAALAGGLFETFFASLRSSLVVIFTLTLVAVLFLIVERRAHQRSPIEQPSWKATIGIGLAQVLALVPGVSRSGITIVAGMFAGLKREDAARFTFLLSIPTVAGAALKKFLDLRDVPFSHTDVLSMLLGIAGAAIVGYVVVRFLMRYLQNHKLDAFAYYRFALAAISTLLLLMK